jgi:hypothetical protein
MGSSVLKQTPFARTSKGMKGQDQAHNETSNMMRRGLSHGRV